MMGTKLFLSLPETNGYFKTRGDDLRDFISFGNQDLLECSEAMDAEPLSCYFSDVFENILLNFCLYRPDIAEFLILKHGNYLRGLEIKRRQSEGEIEPIVQKEECPNGINRALTRVKVSGCDRPELSHAKSCDLIENELDEFSTKLINPTKQSLLDKAKTPTPKASFHATLNIPLAGANGRKNHKRSHSQQFYRPKRLNAPKMMSKTKLKLGSLIRHHQSGSLGQISTQTNFSQKKLDFGHRSQSGSRMEGSLPSINITPEENLIEVSPIHSGCKDDVTTKLPIAWRLNKSCHEDPHRNLRRQLDISVSQISDNLDKILHSERRRKRFPIGEG